MGKRLSENLSSLYIGAANKLKPKCSRRKIIAYVESYDDISFWRTLLGEYENETRYFEVMLPSKTTLAKGKKSVLMNELGPRLGQNMIACVDSDYDYLLQGATHTSRYIINNKYVFHTYAYAIENYQCYAEALHEVCVMATLNDHPLVDFVAFMRMYSQIAYPLFIWSVWFYRKHNLSEFSLLDFCSYVKLDRVSVYHLERSLESMSRRVRRKLLELERRHPKALEEIEAMKTLNDHPLVDFVAFMRMYSQIAYPLFIWSVWFYRKHNLSEFSLLDFCSYVKLDRVSVYHPERSLESMSRRVRRKLLELERRHPKALEEIEAMKREFAKLGVNEDNTYMFIQGHHIMDSVVMRLLVPVCNVLRRERETEIKELAEHNMQFHNELTSYQRRQLGVDIVLRKHTSYKLSPLYKKLEADIERFLKHI